MSMDYNDPGTTASDIGTQFRTDYYYKKALVEAAKEQYFGQLANVRAMPKHMGKTIKQYHYMPILDDRNQNDQGIDASSLSVLNEVTITVTKPSGMIEYIVGNGVDANAALVNANTRFVEYVKDNFLALYTAMAHTTPAADYALQAAVATVKQTVSLDLETLAASDEFTLVYNGITLTAAAADATPTVAELVTALTTTGASNIAAYATLPFLITAGSDALICTWVLAGVVTLPIVLTRTTGTALENDNTISTLGATTLTSAGYTLAAGTAIAGSGNLYGSSKDIGYITGKIPTLTENGGRVNRVGMTRLDLEGSIEKFGFFDEYTQESLDFDTDSELLSHIVSESVKAANELNEDQIQMDLINGAGVIRFTGDATSVDELQGTSSSPDKVDYDDLVKLGIELDNNRCPKNTKVITGSRMVDTKVVNAARYLYMGSELIPSIMKMTDYHSAKAFIPVAQYGSAGTIARGEIGAIDNFRIIVVPEMMKWEGVGAAEGTNGGYYATDGQYDVFPMLVVGEESFTTIGFQTDGKTVKFKIKHKKPDETHDRTDPYGETGFYSIKWYYGLMVLRAERLALIKTVAEI